MELGPMQKRWLEALRSGDYEQGRGAMLTCHVNGDKYCCLGVANVALNLGESDRHYLRLTHDKLGLRSSGGEFIKPIEGKLHSLASMNDKGFTFAQIADIIEADPENVFFKSV